MSGNGEGLKYKHKKRKSKIKRYKKSKFKTRRYKKYKKKTKQNKKRGGRPPVGNECMYVTYDGPGFPRPRIERNKASCDQKPGCTWGHKFSWSRPSRGARPRCYKTRAGN